MLDDRRDTGDRGLKKIKKWSGTQIITRALTGITAISGWFNWIRWLRKRQLSWPKEKMNTKKIHALLYRCPACLSESTLDSRGRRIWCLNCGRQWEMNRHGRIKGKKKAAEYSHILDWIAWEKECVSEEIQKGTYYFEDTVRVEIPARGEKSGQQGIAHFSQTARETRLLCSYDGEEYTMIRTGKTLEKLKIAYDYLGKGDCFEFPSNDGILRCYPAKRDVVTKLAYATEEINRQTQKRA